MAKALIIKGADFSANKVTTITFADNPCTGLSFATDSISITGNESVEVEYTVTPADTTDAITWASSNTSVVTVSDGALTAVGIGTATITATCGNFSATATVSVSITYIPNWQYGHAGVQSNAYISHSSNTLTRISAWGSGAQASEYTSPDTASDGTRNLIKLPANTGRVRISYDTTKKTMLYNEQAHIFWAKDVSCELTGHESAALYLSSEDVDVRTSGSATINVPTGANLLVVVMRLASTRTAEDNPATDAETIGLNIEFLLAS